MKQDEGYQEKESEYQQDYEEIEIDTVLDKVRAPESLKKKIYDKINEYVNSIS